MARIAIVTDSTCNLPADLVARLGLTVVPLNLVIDGQTYRDQVDISTPEFMQKLVTSKSFPSTSQPAPILFEEAYRRLAADHDAILAVVLSSKLSGTHQSAVLAAEAVAGEIPVENVDSLNASFGLGFQVLRAAELVAAGGTLEEIARQLRAETGGYHLVFFVDTLEYLQKGGRIGRAASLVGGLLQLKPLLRIEEGQVIPFERTRTRVRALESLKDFVRTANGTTRLGVLYATDEQEALDVAAELGADLPPDRVIVNQISPVLGAHIGPGGLGVCVCESPVS